MSDTVQLLPLEAITLRILSLRVQRVIVDADLAALYDVPTKRLNEAVKRNRAKFPADSMFTLTDDEFAVLRSQSAISNAGLGGRGGRRYAPRVFTEHGALMAATVLSSPPAIKLSAYVVRAFVRLRELAIAHGDLARRLDELERKTEALTMQHDGFNRSTRNQLKQVFDALRQLMTPPDPPTRPIGFVIPEEKRKKVQGRIETSPSPASATKRKDVGRVVHRRGRLQETFLR